MCSWKLQNVNMKLGGLGKTVESSQPSENTIHVNYHCKYKCEHVGNPIGVLPAAGSKLRGRLPRTVVVGLNFLVSSFFCAMKGIHVKVAKWVLVCENNLKSESTRRFTFWPGSRGDFGPTLKSRYCFYA